MHALLIGIAIWAVFLGACYLYNVRRKRRLRENPPSLSAQQIWDEATPEERREATRSQLFWPSTGAGSGPGGNSNC